MWFTCCMGVCSVSSISVKNINWLINSLSNTDVVLQGSGPADCSHLPPEQRQKKLQSRINNINQEIQREREQRYTRTHTYCTYMLLRINLSFHHMQLCDVICAARSLNTQHVSEVDCLRTRAVVDQWAIWFLSFPPSLQCISQSPWHAISCCEYIHLEKMLSKKQGPFSVQSDRHRATLRTS